MRGSMFELKSKSKARHLWLAALCMGGALLSAASYADGRDDDGWKHRGQHLQRHRDDDRRHDRRHDGRRDYRDHDRRRHDWDRRSDWRRSDSYWQRRDGGRHFHGPDWHYHSGRYWAPPRYRGRYCDDRRHLHDVHYHVAARDYYDYYYPRYSYYGPRPYGANASVIITLPLF